MSFLTNDAPPREDNSEPFLDAVISMTSNDSGGYVGVSALRNSDIMAAVKIIAGDLASNPIEYSDKRIATMLNKNPNDFMTAYAFKFSLAANMLLNGNSFARIERNNSGQVTGLKLIPNSCMVVAYDDDGEAPEYTYTPTDGRAQKLNPMDVLHFKAFTQDGYKGISPLFSLRDELAIQKTGNKLIRGFFQSGVQGTGILKINKSNLDVKAREAIRDKFQAANSGDNALQTIVLDEDTDYSTLQVNTDVVKYANSSDWTTRQVAKAFGLPPERLGVENEHSNQSQSNVAYLQQTLTQYFAAFSSELDMKLSTGDNRFNFNTDRLFSADPESMLKLAAEGLQGGIYTTNEAREKLGLPPVDGGNEVMASLNYTPLSNLANYQNNHTTKGNEVNNG